MKSSKHGKNTLRAEITNISAYGFWLYLDGKEYFLAFENFPWFKQATIEQITDVQLIHGSHLYWSQIDVDLSLNIIESPEKYTLIAK